RQALGRAHDLPHTLIIKPVCECSRRPTIERGAHRDHMVFFGNVLVNRVIGEAGQRKPPAREKHLDFIRSRESPDALKNIAGLFFRQHSALSVQPARRSASSGRTSAESTRLTSTTASAHRRQDTPSKPITRP